MIRIPTSPCPGHPERIQWPPVESDAVQELPGMRMTSERKPHSLWSDSGRVKSVSYDSRKIVAGHDAAGIAGF